jgi:lactate dehydrogenase-like 2-hydroxyacid dehydrogenase
MAIMKLLYIGVCKENLEKYYPAYIKGEFLKDTYTEDDLVDVVIRKNINVLMVDVFNSKFTASLLQQLKGRIKLINFSYQSIDSLIDLKEAEDCGIEVKKLPDDIYCNEVAEFAVAQLLCACKGIIQFDKSIKNGEWNQAINTNFSLRGKTLGVVGFGNIAKCIIKLCENWGMNILVTRKSLNVNQNIPNVTFVDFDHIIQQSDFIIFAVPLNDETFQMLNMKHINKMGKKPIIVNVSRGNIVDEDAIDNALRSGKIYRYCADVFPQEPVNSDHSFLSSDKTILSPHVAWATEDTLKKTYDVWFDQTYF